MKTRHLQDDELDRIGQTLIKGSMLRTDEIERIADSPRLFADVMKRADAGSTVRPRMFILRPVFAASFAAIVCAFVIVGYFMARQPVDLTVVKPVNPEPQQRSVQPLQYAKQTEPDVVSPTRPDELQAPVQRAIIRKREDLRDPKRKRSAEPDQQLEFFPITYTGDPNENVSGGRVIRVEMSRASLFAMGVNVPIDNGTELVKADLLVGPDGVPRAIRIPN